LINLYEKQNTNNLPFNRSVIDKLWIEHKNKKRDNGYVLWHFLIFILWYNQSFSNNRDELLIN